MLLYYAQHCSCSHLPQCYFSASVPSLKCARARGMSSMSSSLLPRVPRGRVVSQFVCVSTVFLPGKVGLVKWLVLRMKAITHKLKKASFVSFELYLNRAFYFDNHLVNSSWFSCMTIVTRLNVVRLRPPRLVRD